MSSSSISAVMRSESQQDIQKIVSLGCISWPISPSRRMIMPSAGAVRVISASWRLAPLERRLGRLQFVARLVERGFGASVVPEELTGASILHLAIAHARLPLRHRGSQLAIVELRQHLALVHGVALVNHELRQPARYLRPNGQHDHGLDRAWPIDSFDGGSAHGAHYRHGYGA